MTPLRPPTEKEAFKGQLGQAMEEIEAKMDENGLERYMQAAEELLEEYSAQDLVALLVKTIAKDPADMVPVKITPERPLPSSKKGFNKNNRRGGNSRNRRDYNRDGKYGRNKKDYGKDKRRENRKNNKIEKKRDFVIRSNH